MNITLKKFKAELSKETGIDIDFRTHQYLLNNYGLSPVTDYDAMELLLRGSYTVAHKFLEELNTDFSGWEWNFDMEMDSLRVGTIKDHIEGLIHDLNNLVYR